MKLAKMEQIGTGVEIDRSVQFDKDLDYLEIGDYTYIGPNVRITGKSLKIGEYSKIHQDTYINAKKSVELGHCTWIGQGSHLDGTGGIVAGDFLGVGINSALYSHIRHGDILEGCRFDQDKELRIGNDVWFVGMCLVSPVLVKDKSVALLGSVITRNMETNSVYGGNPASDLTSKIGKPWSEVSVESKRQNFLRLRDEFFAINKRFDKEKIQVLEDHSYFERGVTYYSVLNRSYTKINSTEEVAFNKWIFPYRAKFRPSVSV